MIVLSLTQYQYPLRLDDNVVRSVASFTFFMSTVIWFNPDLRWLVYLMSIDFILRYIHPKISPLALTMKNINLKLLKNDPVFKFAPPKRFAVLIGVLVTSLMSLALLFSQILIFDILLVTMLIASGLQSWFDYCLGCTVYDYMVKANLIAGNENLGEFLAHLKKVSTLSEISESNVMGIEQIRNELFTIASQLDGKLNETEHVLLEQIMGDLNEYISLIDQAMEDGIISSKEKTLLIDEGKTIANSSVNLSHKSIRARTYLIMVQDYVEFLTRNLAKNWNHV